MAMGRSGFDREVESTVGEFIELIEVLVVFLGRFFSGREMDGERRTDATFFRPGKNPLISSAVRPGAAASSATAWSFWPYWRRAAARLAVLAAAGSVGYACWRYPDTALGLARSYGPQAAIAAAGAVVLVGVGSGIFGRGRRKLKREWVEPLHEALAKPLGLPPHTRPDYIHLPKNFTDDDAEIRIDLPTGLHFSKDLVAELIEAKLGLENMSFTWRRSGRVPHVLVKPANRPPRVLRLSTPGVREMLAKAAESAPLIGLGPGKRKVAVDLDDESPHVLISAGTGGGKSTILRGITCQFLHNGALAWILDYKRISHPWARGVPGATYCRDIADIHEALIDLGTEGRQRIQLAEDLGDDVLETDPGRAGPRLVILLEEVNATMRQLARYWEKIRQKGDPKTSPAVDALAEILFMGRQVRLHVLLVAQSATARALGGPEMREQFSTRILSRYTVNAWRMLVPEVLPIPKSTTHPGRVQVVQSATAHETQVLFFTESEARQWATSGTRPPTRTSQLTRTPAADDAPQPHKPSPATDAAPASLPDNPATDRPAAITTALDPASPDRQDQDDDAVLGLRQAQVQHLTHLTLAALRWARAHDPDFPDPAGKRGAEYLYSLGDIKRWARNRPRDGGQESG